MADFPEKTCTIDALVTHKKLVRAVLEGRKTQQRRNGVYGYPDEVFALDGVDFRITRLAHLPLGEMTEADALAEGMQDLAAYKDLILRMHKGMGWDPEHRVWMHEFQRVDAS